MVTSLPSCLLPSYDLEGVFQGVLHHLEINGGLPGKIAKIEFEKIK